MNLGNKILFVILFLAPTAVFAQEENDFFISSYPATPSANQSFTVEAKSFIFDASDAYITWIVDGKKIDEGNGITKKIIQGKGVGTKISVRASATSNEGKSYSAFWDYNINDIDLILNPLTYVPFGYRGQALPTPGSFVEIYAVPHIFSGGRRLSPQNLTYEWKIENTPVKEQSGRGKNKLTAKLPKTPQGETVVSLETYSDGQLVGQKTKKIAIHSPQIIFYETSSLLGKKVKALSELTAKPGTQFALAVEPFFSDFNSLFTGAVSWFAGGTKIEPSRAENLFVLELTSPNEEESENNILFKLEDEKNVFQNKEGRINVKIRN